MFYRRTAIALATCAALTLIVGNSAPVGAATNALANTAVDTPAAPTWNLSYPISIDYKALDHDPAVKCNGSDAIFQQQVTQEGFDKYQALVVSGIKGSCGRLAAEQFKRLYPAKPVIQYEKPNGSDPSTFPGGTWPGYYLMMNRAAANNPVSASQTNIAVSDATRFSPGDMAVMWSPTPSDAYANGEYVKVTAVSSSAITVDRDVFATGAVTYPQPPLIAALAIGPSYPSPEYNYSDMAPVNPANGLQARQWMAANMVADFAPSDANNTTLDAMEFDAAGWFPFASNVNGSGKNLDCNGDGVVDYCNRGVGTAQQVNTYGFGYDTFVQAVKSGLAQYDTDPTKPTKMLLADGESGFRSLASANGAEFESFPNWDNYTGSSSALAQLGMWAQQDTAPGSHMSYAFTKDITPVYNQVSALNPNGCITPANGGTCRNASFRYGMASSLITGAGFTYNNEESFNYPQPLDEEGGISQATTGLSPGYLGAPLGPAQRVAHYTSGELATNSSFELNLNSLGTTVASGALMRIVPDQTTAAPGFGTSSVRADVSAILADPSLGDAKITQALIGPVLANQDYTVDFWAKAAGSAPGPQVVALGVAMNAVTGTPPQVVEVGTSWTHFTMSFHTTVAQTKPNVKFSMGQGVGSYWLDGVSVHQGTAGIVTRQYTNGIAVLNDAATPQTNIALPGGPYHHINGVQDRTVNDGTSVGSTLPSIDYKDGEILLRG